MLTAWINTQLKVISFHEIEEAEIYLSQGKSFWEYIIGLVSTGYRMQ